MIRDFNRPKEVYFIFNDKNKNISTDKFTGYIHKAIRHKIEVKGEEINISVIQNILFEISENCRLFDTYFKDIDEIDVNISFWYEDLNECGTVDGLFLYENINAKLIYENIELYNLEIKSGKRLTPIYKVAKQ